MAVCVTVNQNDSLALNTTPVQNCTEYVLFSASEYTTLPTLVDVFSMPLSTDLGQMWAIGFSLPLILYLTAWGFSTVIKFIK